jgi:hypothetical protein
MDAGVADALNRRAVRLIVEHLDDFYTPKYNDRRNTCTCVHCAPFLDARHGNGCVGFHCSGSCVRVPTRPWFQAPIADTILGTNDATNADRAWLVGTFAAKTPGLDFDGPADADWENLFMHFRAEILARRDPQNPTREGVRDAPWRSGVGSR